MSIIGEKSKSPVYKLRKILASLEVIRGSYLDNVSSMWRIMNDEPYALRKEKIYDIINASNRYIGDAIDVSRRFDNFLHEIAYNIDSFKSDCNVAICTNKELRNHIEHMESKIGELIQITHQDQGSVVFLSDLKRWQDQEFEKSLLHVLCKLQEEGDLILQKLKKI